MAAIFLRSTLASLFFPAYFGVADPADLSLRSTVFSFLTNSLVTLLPTVNNGMPESVRSVRELIINK